MSTFDGYQCDGEDNLEGGQCRIMEPTDESGSPPNGWVTLHMGDGMERHYCRLHRGQADLFYKREEARA